MHKSLAQFMLISTFCGLSTASTQPPNIAPANHINDPQLSNTPLNTIGKDTLLPTAYLHCAPNKYGALVMDSKTGNVILSHNAHKQLYPASMVKMMTTLLALEKLERGEWHMNTKLTVPPLNFTTENLATVGLKTGKTVNVEKAILYTHVVSAADAAETIAYNIAGSKKSFVAQMNQRATDLGMCDTHFMNASGDRDNFYGAVNNGIHAQVSSPHDMALLIKALSAKEEYRDFLATKQVYCAERSKVYNNHALKPELLAAAAIVAKTGEIDASGKNISVMFADNKIVVLFGARRTPDRITHLLELKKTADSLVSINKPKPIWPDVKEIGLKGLDRANFYQPPINRLARSGL